MTDRDREGEALDEERDRWIYAVGRFVLAFGGIESALRDALEAIPADWFDDAIFDLPLDRKVRILESILRDRHDATGNVKRLLAVLARVRESVGVRNLVAHNPVNIVPLYDGGEFVEIVEARIYHYYKRGRQVDLNALKKRGDEAHELEQNLRSAVEEYLAEDHPD